MTVLEAGSRVAKVAKPGPHLGHVRRAHAETGCNLHQGNIRTGQHAIPQILPISLSTPSSHLPPPVIPEALESHIAPVSEEGTAIPLNAIWV